MAYTLAQIAALVNGTLEGDASAKVQDVAEIQHARSGQLTFLANPKYHKHVATTQAEAILVDREFSDHYKNLIRVDNPNYAFAQLIERFRPELPLPKPGIDPSAKIAPSARIDATSYIGPHVVLQNGVKIGGHCFLFANSYIGLECEIGTNTVIYPNVTIYPRCRIGDHVRVHAGTVIGSDGYGFVRTDQGISKIPQAGGVVIGEEVEIGANCAIDRGTIGNTVIGRGTKLDNLIQVGHNVKIGEYCFIAGQTGLAGSCQMENYVTVGGQVGIAGHLTIGEKAQIAGQSGITKDVPPGTIMFGYPAREQKKARREIAYIRKLPELNRKINRLEKEIELLRQGK